MITSKDKSEAGIWPPESKRDEMGFHWFHSERSSYSTIAQWSPQAQGWWSINEIGVLTPENIAARGWEYLGPVTNRPYSWHLGE